LKKFFTFFAFAVLLAGVVYINFQNTESKEVVEIQCEHGVSVISFSSPNCTACERQKKELEKVELSMSSDAGFTKVDITKDLVSADHYQIGIVPTIIVVNDGLEVERLSGIQYSDHIEEIINREIMKGGQCRNGNSKGVKNGCKC
jgi:thioredoxin-like negative regulator of GroEL